MDAAFLHERLAAQAIATPDAVALMEPSMKYEDRSLTYAELHSKAEFLAHHLLSAGLSSWDNTLVGIHFPRCIESVVALVALGKIGCPYVPLDPNYPRAHLEHIVSTAGLKWLVTDTTFLSKKPDVKPTEKEASGKGETKLGLTVPADCRVIDLAPVSFGPSPGPVAPRPATALNSEALLYVLFTSGSSGPPKGVCGPHAATLNRIDWMLEVGCLASP